MNEYFQSIGKTA